MTKSKRVVVNMSNKDYEKLQALSRSNTSGNAAQLVRSLVARAFMLPAEFGLLPPVKEGDSNAENS